MGRTGAHTSFDADGVDVVGRLPRPISLVAGVDRVCGLRCYAQMAESASGIHGMDGDGAREREWIHSCPVKLLR
jgi:hypothetical protein